MASSSSSSSDYADVVASQVPSSGVFRFSDREAMSWATESRASFVAKPISPPKSHAERIAEVAANNTSKLPFLDTERHLTSDNRAHYVHHGAAYLPANMSVAAETGNGSTIVLGHNHAASVCAACSRAATHGLPPAPGTELEPMNSQHRASYQAVPLPKALTHEERQAAIQATRSGAAVLRVFGERPPESVSQLEAANRHMLASPSSRLVPGAGGNGKVVDRAASGELAKTVSVELGTDPRMHETEYRLHNVDYAAGRPASQNPYRTENRVHEVDPSAHAGQAGLSEEAAWRLTVVAADGQVKDIHRVRSAIDFGHDDYEVRSVYMDQFGVDKARLTAAGGWHRNLTSFVPTLRPKFAANRSHPAVLQQQA